MHVSCSIFCFFRRQPKMIDEALAQFRAHRQNINRYRSLLQTTLTDLERKFIERRIVEEESAVSALAFAAAPPNGPFRGRHGEFFYDPDAP